ncbi:hypothetical protein ABPG77_004158 [Micractinium sp. CCAP 211/92]
MAVCHAMHVPRDTFKSGRSPEEQAAHMLSLLCTAVAVSVVLAQLGGGGEGGDLPPTPDFLRLRDFLAARPLTSGSGDEWLAGLMAQHPLLGVRVLEVRQAYCSTQLDWQAVRQLAQQLITESNVRLLRQHAADSFGSALAAGSCDGDRAEEGGEGGGPGSSRPAAGG